MGPESEPTKKQMVVVPLGARPTPNVGLCSTPSTAGRFHACAHHGRIQHPIIHSSRRPSSRAQCSAQPRPRPSSRRSPWPGAAGQTCPRRGLGRRSRHFCHGHHHIFYPWSLVHVVQPPLPPRLDTVGLLHHHGGDPTMKPTSKQGGPPQNLTAGALEQSGTHRHFRHVHHHKQTLPGSPLRRCRRSIDLFTKCAHHITCTSIHAIIVAGLMLISRAPARKTSDNSGSTLSTATHTLYLSQSSLLIFSPPLSSTLPEKPFPLHVSFV